MLRPSSIPLLHPDESLPSAVSRTAVLNGRSARDFCVDLGLTFSGIVEGRQADVARFNELVGGPKANPAVVVVGSGRSFEVAGNMFTRDTMSRKRIRVCPCCLAEDIENGKGSLATRAYGRIEWLIDAIRTCPRHDVALKVASDDDSPSTVHDIAYLIQPFVMDLERHLGDLVRRSPSVLETHLLKRLRGQPSEDGWMAEFPAYAVCRISEYVGATHLYGPRFVSANLRDDDWHAAASVGFEIADAGPDGIVTVLRELTRTFEKTRHPWGGRMVFGRLYEWLAHENDDPAYEPLRGVIRRFAEQHMPLGPGDVFLGQPVLDRKVHSVRTLELETGEHPKRLRKLLIASGVLGKEDQTRSNDRVLVRVSDLAEIGKKTIGTVTLKEAARYLNLPRPHERLFLEAGLIKPVVDTTHRGALKRVFAIADLDDLLEKMTQRATPVGSEKTELLPLLAAAKRANCSATEIVQAILAGTIATVRLDILQRGFMALLVDLAEVKPIVRGEDHAGVSLREVSRRMGTNDRVVKALIEHGHLPSRRAINAVNKCPQTVVDQKDIDLFGAEFVSLATLSKETGRHFRQLLKALTSDGIKSAFEPRDVGARFYRRADLRDHSIT